MSSLLTNTAAMTALQTLRTVNSELKMAEDQISTGKRIATAKDNAGIWAVASVMESDLLGFQSISESIGLGNSALNIAYSAANSVTEALKLIKKSVVAGQEDSIDRNKIQNDIEQLKNQIRGVVDTAQFNGLNLLKGFDDVEILGAINRTIDGTVTPSRITFERQNLEMTGHSFGAGTTVPSTDVYGTALTSIAAATGTAPALVATSSLVDFKKRDTLEGDSYSIQLTVPQDFIEGATANTTIKVEFVAGKDLTQDSVARNLKYLMDIQFAKYNVKGLSVNLVQSDDVTLSALKFTNSLATAVTVATDFKTDGTRGGNLLELSDLSVKNKEEARASLAKIEYLMNKAIDVSAILGSFQKRMEVQVEFINRIKDALKAGVGNLVDADMEEAAAQLQAKQVQQQLAIKALTIANGAPQNILALFQN